MRRRQLAIWPFVESAGIDGGAEVAPASGRGRAQGGPARLACAGVGPSQQRQRCGQRRVFPAASLAARKVRAGSSTVYLVVATVGCLAPDLLAEKPAQVSDPSRDADCSIGACQHPPEHG